MYIEQPLFEHHFLEVNWQCQIQQRRVSSAYFSRIDAVVERPHGLEVVLHPVLQLLGHRVQNREVFQIAPLKISNRFLVY